MTVALVTGGNRGIGRAVARQLAEQSVEVWLGSRDLDAGRDVAAEMAVLAGGVTAVQLDVTDADSVRSAVTAIADAGHGLDVLVNNAGTDYDTDQRAETADLDRVRSTVEVNTLGPLRVAQEAAPLLRDSGHGRIVNVSSGSGSLADMGGGTPGYSISKAAVNAVTRLLAAELADAGVLVNSVCPGWVRTDMGGPSATRSPDEGAAGIVWAATLDDGGPTGGFFRDGQPIDW